MKTAYIKYFVPGIILAAAPLLASAEWQITKTTDEMDDSTSYLIATTGATVEASPLLKYTPALIIRLTPKFFYTDTKIFTGKIDVYVAMEHDGISRFGGEATLRLDDAPAQQWGFTASTDRRAAFLKNSSTALRLIRQSQKMRLRLETTLGAIRTFSFDTSGLSDKIDQIRAQIASERPAGVKFTTTPKTKKK